MPKGGRRPIVLALVACAMAAPAQAATIEIVMDNLAIAPAEVSARVGDTIVWTNKDAFAHTATANGGDFDLTLPPHKTASLELSKAGTIDYYCRYHPNMKATLKITP